MEVMKKNFIKVLILFIALVIIGTIIYIVYRNTSSGIKDVYSEDSYKQNNVIKELESNIADINSKMDMLQSSDIILKIGENVVTKSDIEEMQQINEAMNRDVDPVIDTARQAVAIQEAKKIGIEISDESKDTYESVAEKMYKSYTGELTKEQYMEKWMRIQENEEIAYLFMAKIMKQIVSNEFICEDETVNQNIEAYYNDITTTKLREAYDAYLDYLLSKYSIEY